MVGPTLFELKFGSISQVGMVFLFDGPDYHYVGPTVELWRARKRVVPTQSLSAIDHCEDQTVRISPSSG